jgi:hypothetical protein
LGVRFRHELLKIYWANRAREQSAVTESQMFSIKAGKAAAAGSS